MIRVVMQYHDLGKWKWNSDKQVEVYANGDKLGTYVGMKPQKLLKVIRERLGVKKVKSTVCQWISPQMRAIDDLEYLVADAYCPISVFWENVGRDKDYVMKSLKGIAQLRDEKEYKKALVSLMNKYI